MVHPRARAEAWQLRSARPSHDLRSQLIEMPEIGPHGLQEWLNTLGECPGIEEITFDPERFYRFGLIPHQTSGDRGGIDIKGRYVRGAPPLARWDEARKASAHGVVLAGKAPNRFAAQSRVLIQGIERHIVGLDQWWDGAITDPL